MLWNILVQFIFRLTFGLAAAMAGTSPALVTAGYFRVHLWVALGLTTFAGVAIASGEAGLAPRGLIFQLALAAGIASYVGSVIWLYEQRRIGRWALGLVAALALAAAHLAIGQAQLPELIPTAVPWLGFLDICLGGLLLGCVIAAMFLGHWYLNNPGMQLAPLKRLIWGIAITGLLRMLLCGWGLSGELAAGNPHQSLWWTLVAIRWLAGLVGTLFLAGMTWQTLRIPNTQSATGILYVAVITVFLGELSSQFLSATSHFPL